MHRVALFSLFLAACSGPKLTSIDPFSLDGGISSASPNADHPDSGLIPPDTKTLALVSVTPSHGPWTGGTRITVRGSGFNSGTVFRVAGVDILSGDLLISDATRATFLMPPGVPGVVSFEALDASTGRVARLRDAFEYDAFVVEPGTGALSGGTRVIVRGKGAHYTGIPSVHFGAKPCTEVALVNTDSISCLTPANAAGPVPVSLRVAAAPDALVGEAFRYEDSPDGYRGGLSGGALSGTLKVLALDATTGFPLAGAAVFARTTSTTLRAVTGAQGRADLTDPSLQGRVTVTVAAKCHHPFTFVDVPVDTVTIYTGAVMDPACAEGDPPSFGGGQSAAAGLVRGEITWTAPEMKREGWKNVPAPTRPDELRVAYIFDASPDPRATFQLPPPEEAITPTSTGERGYGFQRPRLPGNATLYGLAGLELRTATERRFTAYAFGLTRGVTVTAGEVTANVDISLDNALDRALDLDISTLAPSAAGPDRLDVSAAVALGTGSYAIMPSALRSLPLTSRTSASIVGLPGLLGSLTGAAVVVDARASTGPNRELPISAITGYRIPSLDMRSSLGGFLPIPIVPGSPFAPFGGTHFSVSNAGGCSLIVTRLVSGGGLVGWTVVAPGGSTVVDLPSLAALPTDFDLRSGALAVRVTCARVDNFSYDRMRLGQATEPAWAAFAARGYQGRYAR